jgi:transposase
MAYSLDLRNKAVKYIENGGTWLSASQTFGIAVRTLAHWLRRKKQNNLSPTAREKGSYKIDETRLKNYIAMNPDAYLREIAEEFGVTIPAIFYACRRGKITLKKRHRTTKKGTKKSERNL